MARVRALIEAFNASLLPPGTTVELSPGLKVSGSVDLAEFEKKLQGLGARTDETLVQVSWEDLEHCGLPKLLAKQVAGELRGAEASDAYVSQKKVDRMSFEQLLERYDPRDDNLVAKKLRELSGGKRFIVFEGDQVDQKASLRLLLELKRGMGEVPIAVSTAGGPAKTYKVGDVPNDELDENPLYPGRALRTDETCDQTLRSWKGIAPQIRQLVYLAVTRTGEIKVSSLADAHDVLDRCLAKEAVDNPAHFTSRYPKATLIYRELQDKSQLPRLKVKPGGGAGNDPFFQGRPS
jgi:hypothetical protein